MSDDVLLAQSYFESSRNAALMGSWRRSRWPKWSALPRSSNKRRQNPRRRVNTESMLARSLQRRGIEELTASGPDEASWAPDFWDLDSTTSSQFLEKPLDKRHFNMVKDMPEGSEFVIPQWSHCLSYELDIRKQVYKLSRSAVMGIRAALWQVIGDSEHRTTHWVQLVAMANSSLSQTMVNKGGLDDVRKEIKALHSAVDRSRTPRGYPHGGAPARLALPKPTGDGKRKKAKVRKAAVASTANILVAVS